MFKEIAYTLVGAGIAGLITYKSTVDVNESSISALRDSIEKLGTNNRDSFYELKKNDENTRITLTELRLTVARAHPNLRAETTSSIRKLQQLNADELKALSIQLPELTAVIIEADAYNMSAVSTNVNTPEIFQALASKYQISGKDLSVYYDIAELEPDSNSQNWK